MKTAAKTIAAAENTVDRIATANHAVLVGGALAIKAAKGSAFRVSDLNILRDAVASKFGIHGGMARAVVELALKRQHDGDMTIGAAAV